MGNINLLNIWMIDLIHDLFLHVDNMFYVYILFLGAKPRRFGHSVRFETFLGRLEGSKCLIFWIHLKCYTFHPSFLLPTSFPNFSLFFLKRNRVKIVKAKIMRTNQGEEVWYLHYVEGHQFLCYFLFILLTLFLRTQRKQDSKREGDNMRERISVSEE